MKYLIYIMSLCLLASCSSYSTNLNVDKMQDKVLLAQDDLSQGIVVKKSKLVALENGQMQADVTLESLFETAQNLEYRVYWYDAQNLELNAKENDWHAFTLPALTKLNLLEEATSSNVKDFRVQIRRNTAPSK